MSQKRCYVVALYIHHKRKNQNFRKAQSCWTTLKNHLKKEGSEIVTFCDNLKLQSADGNIKIKIINPTLLFIISPFPCFFVFVFLLG